MQYLYVLDDIGFADKKNLNGTDSQDRTTVGCLLPLEKLMNVAMRIYDALNDATNNYKIKHFCFDDMYNRKNGYENIKPEDFLRYTKVFVKIIKDFDIKVIVQNFTEEMYNNKKLLREINLVSEVVFKTKPEGKITPEGYAFVMNLYNAYKYIVSSNRKSDIAEIMCDETLKTDKAITHITLNEKDSIKVSFRARDDYPYLYLADFVVWALKTLENKLVGTNSGEEIKQNKMILELLETIRNNYIKF